MVLWINLTSILLNTRKQLRKGKTYFSICDTLNTKKDFVRTECIINALAINIVFIL